MYFFMLILHFGNGRSQVIVFFQLITVNKHYDLSKIMISIQQYK